MDPGSLGKSARYVYTIQINRTRQRLSVQCVNTGGYDYSPRCCRTTDQDRVRCRCDTALAAYEMTQAAARFVRSHPVVPFAVWRCRTGPRAV